MVIRLWSLDYGHLIIVILTQKTPLSGTMVVSGVGQRDIKNAIFINKNELFIIKIARFKSNVENLYID